MGYELDADIARVRAGFVFMDKFNPQSEGVRNVRNFPAAEFDFVGVHPKPKVMQPGITYTIEPPQK